MSKWTPGPWEVVYKDGTYTPLTIHAPNGNPGPGGIMDILRRGGNGSISLPTSDEGKANARLIAAAPELAHELGAQCNVLDAIRQACINAVSNRQTLDHICGICEAQTEKPRALLARIDDDNT